MWNDFLFESLEYFIKENKDIKVNDIIPKYKAQ